MIRSKMLPVLAVVLSVVVLLSGCGSHQADSPSKGADATDKKRVLAVYQWADYFDPAVIKSFEHDTGIHVIYSTFDSQDVMQTKMMTGSTGYDVVDVASYSLDKLIRSGVLRKLDRTRLRGWGNLDADLMRDLEQFDPGNQHAVGYLWGTTGVFYNERALSAALGEKPPHSWALVFDPRYAGKAAQCGLSFNSDRIEIIGNALISIGADPNHPTPQQMKAAEAVLQRIRPFVRRIDGPSQISELTSGSMCLFVGAGSNVAIARARNKESGVDMDLRYLIPKEGAVSWFDVLAIPVDAPHAAEAYEFLDYLLRPAIAARNANYTGSSTVNRAALPLVDAALRNDPMLYPGPAVHATLRPLISREPDQARAETQLWTRFEFSSSQ